MEAPAVFRFGADQAHCLPCWTAELEESGPTATLRAKYVEASGGTVEIELAGLTIERGADGRVVARILGEVDLMCQASRLVDGAAALRAISRLREYICVGDVTLTPLPADGHGRLRRRPPRRARGDF